MGKIQIWEIQFECNEKKYVDATGIDDALQKARDWSQEEMDKERKNAKNNKEEFDEEQFAYDFDVVGVSIYVETDI